MGLKKNNLFLFLELVLSLIICRLKKKKLLFQSRGGKKIGYVEYVFLYYKTHLTICTFASLLLAELGFQNELSQCLLGLQRKICHKIYEDGHFFLLKVKLHFTISVLLMSFHDYRELNFI